MTQKNHSFITIDQLIYHYFYAKEVNFKSFREQPQHKFHSDSHAKLSYNFRSL